MHHVLVACLLHAESRYTDIPEKAGTAAAPKDPPEKYPVTSTTKLAVPLATKLSPIVPLLRATTNPLARMSFAGTFRVEVPAMTAEGTIETYAGLC